MSVEHSRRIYSDTSVQNMIDRLAQENTGLPVDNQLQNLTNWTEAALHPQRIIMAELAMKHRISEIIFLAWSGIQGAGKGTNLDAISKAAALHKTSSHWDNYPTPLQTLITTYSGDAENIVTGTGGIFVPQDGSPYQSMFTQLKAITIPITREGNLLPDSLTTYLVQTLELKAIENGKSVFQVDLHPRTNIQYDHIQEQIITLRERGIQGQLNMVDLRLLSNETIEQMKNNPSEYAEVSTQIGSKLKRWFKENEVRLRELTPTRQHETISDRLGQIKKEYHESNNTPGIALVDEVESSTNRMNGRGRGDDSPLPMLQRNISYLTSTAPGLMHVPGIKFVSALPAADKVVGDLIGALIDNPEVLQHPHTQSFIASAQKAALEKVNGHYR